MSTSILGGLAGLAGAILSLLLWVWRKSERRAGALEKEVQVAWAAARASESFRKEEAERHGVVVETLQARVGRARDELNTLITKASKNEKSPALRAAVMDYLDGIFLSADDPEPGGSAPVAKVRPKKAPAPARNGKGGA